MLFEESNSFSKNMNCTQNSVSTLSPHELSNENVLEPIENNASFVYGSKGNEGTPPFQIQQGNIKCIHTNKINAYLPPFANTLQIFSNNLGMIQNPFFLI